VDELLAKITTAGVVYYHADALGSTVALTNETGNLVESYAYDAFGTPSIRNGSGLNLPVSGFENRFLFTGRELLRDAGIYDYRNRVYSSSLGRFLQTDPIRFQAGDVNLYRYVGNNPINWTDPLGEAIWFGLIVVPFLLYPDPVNAPGPCDPTYHGTGGMAITAGQFGAQGRMSAPSVAKAAANKAFTAVTNKAVSPASPIQRVPANSFPK